MEIRLDGEILNLRFSCAHFLPTHTKCERIHGHDYAVSVEIGGANEKGMVVDFLLVERQIREIIDEIDHHLLIPNQSDVLEWHKSGENLLISYNGRLLSIPEVYTFHIDADSSSSEDLSIFLLNSLWERLKNEKNVKSLKLCLHEGPGRVACAEKR